MTIDHEPYDPTEITGLILASGSPRRRELLQEAGYRFEVQPASSNAEGATAECGNCSGESPAEFVARMAFQKAADVAKRYQIQPKNGLILACDTIAECCGQRLGKPQDRQHARQMLTILRGREHRVFSGVCLWRIEDGKMITQVDVTTLLMEKISDVQLTQYLDSQLWQGKAGAFGYQDRNDWLKIIKGSESNVVGLPLELLKPMFIQIRQE